MRFSSSVFVVTAAVLSASIAQAGLINFSLVGPGDFSSYLEQGVTFTTAVPGGLITSQTFGVAPNGTFGLLGYVAGPDFREIRADIAGGAASVSIDLGDKGSDPDGLFLEIYNSASTLLNSTTLLTTNADTTMHTLSLSNPNIAYAIYGARAPSLSGSSVYTDNFAWTAAAATPEPGTMLLLAAGLAGIGLYRRRIA